MEREGDAGAVILRLLHSLIASDRINRDKFEGLKIRDGDEGEPRRIKRVSHSNSGRSVELSFLSGLAAVISRKSGRPEFCAGERRKKDPSSMRQSAAGQS